ncbi:hypothetical protein O3M35_009801 [Rhynocoris fuscipes]|uniref:PHD-type domain-containing protein n=1 Tax=Rhynocoris fuscipes TaxID=488301 RepID=A0AAW1D510_9HEMI
MAHGDKVDSMLSCFLCQNTFRKGNKLVYCECGVVSHITCVKNSKLNFDESTGMWMCETCTKTDPNLDKPNTTSKSCNDIFKNIDWDINPDEQSDRDLLITLINQQKCIMKFMKFIADKYDKWHNSLNSLHIVLNNNEILKQKIKILENKIHHVQSKESHVCERKVETVANNSKTTLVESFSNKAEDNTVISDNSITPTILEKATDKKKSSPLNNIKDITPTFSDVVKNDIEHNETASPTVDHLNIQSDNNTEENGESWKTVTTKKRKTKRIIGTATSGDSESAGSTLVAGNRKMWLYVGKIKKNTTVEEVLKFLKFKLPTEEFVCEKLDSKGCDCININKNIKDTDSNLGCDLGFINRISNLGNNLDCDCININKNNDIDSNLDSLGCDNIDVINRTSNLGNNSGCDSKIFNNKVKDSNNSNVNIGLFFMNIQSLRFKFELLKCFG